MATAGAAVPFFDRSAPQDFLEVNLHALVGGSAVTQNYMSTFPEIQELNTAMGLAYGMGAGVTFGLRQWLGLGTELNVVVNRNRMDCAVSNTAVTSMSNLFMRNHYTYINIPVFLSLRFYPATGLRWNVDLGMYYSYGVGGSQRQTLYNWTTNDLGQIVPKVVESKPSYFGSSDTFLNGYKRGDIGLHLATALLFRGHVSVGGRMGVGFKNISRKIGVLNPNIHNINFLVSVGYHF
ncbi:MAG: PorT family protein [Bacteroidales bacterium]|nr:PorT family protein [Bacteroidales bacterium]